jgi:hypothetical protein
VETYLSFGDKENISVKDLFSEQPLHSLFHLPMYTAAFHEFNSFHQVPQAVETNGMQDIWTHSWEQTFLFKSL